MRRVVITGLGVVNALGVGCDRFWRRLVAGESGLRAMARMPAAGLRNDLAGEVPADEWAEQEPAAPPSARGFAAYAAAEAAAQAGLSLTPWPGAVVYATNFGGQHEWFERTPAPDSLAALDFHAAATSVTSAGPAITLSNACSSGTHAVGHAADLVRLGYVDVALACGFDELGLFCLSGLSILHTITTDTIRPFDRKRSGTIFGEGAAALIVEDADHARARGADPLAEVLGYGVNNNAFHMTAPDHGGEGMVQVIRRALAQADLPADRVGHVNAHATGTEYHDPAEAAAVLTVLGDHGRRIPVSAIKAATGHAMGAAGAIEAVACVLALCEQVAPPTLNLDEPDDACPLDHVVGQARHAQFDVALSVSAGLGGNNAAVLLGRV